MGQTVVLYVCYFYARVNFKVILVTAKGLKINVLFSKLCILKSNDLHISMV